VPANSVKRAYAVYISVRDELGSKRYEYYGSFSQWVVAFDLRVWQVIA
jgi:hypothetical protein